MRLAVLGHSCVLARNQAKYVALRRLDPELKLRLIVPRWTPNPVYRMRYATERNEGLSASELVTVGAAFARSHMLMLFDPRTIARTFYDFQPDVVHVEEESHALLSVEAAILRAAFAPRAALTFFTWDNLLRSRRFPLGAAKKFLRRFTLARTDALVCGNREAERLARLEGCAPATYVLPQFGLDPADHVPGTEPELRRELGLGDGIVVGYAGRLIAEKGLRLLYESLAALPDHPWKLLLVGGGPLETKISNEWIPRFPGKIVRIPPVSHAEVPRYLRAMDIFVLNSYEIPTWKEQFGLSLAQAMMLGLACLASDSGALPEVADDAAVVVGERNAAELRSALEALLASPDFRRTLGQRARQRALERYTNEEVALRYREVFEQAATRRAGLSHAPQMAAPSEAPHRATRR
jgi:glycosyltransferase involved in cell wall biosynthesis